jgi:hypothetical protein
MADAGSRQMHAKAVVIAGKVLVWATGIACLVAALPAMSTQISTSEFLGHCDAAPEPCKEKVLAYVKFLADGGFLHQCITQLSAADTAAKLIEWMRDHPEEGEEDWVDCLDNAVAALKLCSP